MAISEDIHLSVQTTEYKMQTGQGEKKVRRKIKKGANHTRDTQTIRARYIDIKSVNAQCSQKVPIPTPKSLFKNIKRNTCS